MRMPLNWLSAPVGIAMIVAAWSAWETRQQDEFVHSEHQGLFPTCRGCHELGPSGVTVPDAESCFTCHDGETEAAVEWEPTAPPHSNLDFNHVRVIELETAALGEDRPCASCHTPEGGERMEVERVVVLNCLDCHARGTRHYEEAPCDECHVPLVAAKELTVAELRDFPRPEDHQLEGFLLNHELPAGHDVSRCSVCHARESCSSCHVNAPSVAAIRALAPDPRVSELASEREIVYPTPATHESDDWLTLHGGAIEDEGARACETCHAQNSCQACHVGPLPALVRALPETRADLPAVGDQLDQERGPGVAQAREPPPSHTPLFLANHSAESAAAAAVQCQVCHTQNMCLSCHTGSEALVRTGRVPGRFHALNYLQQHNADAFGQATECASCHNTLSFCLDCHRGQGIASRGRIDAGFHNSQPTFVFGHGQAARQGLESCASCHAERDCAVCHSARGGRRVNPHGPGFDADRLASRNPQMCLLCHFSAILDR